MFLTSVPNTFPKITSFFPQNSGNLCALYVMKMIAPGTQDVLLTAAQASSQGNLTQYPIQGRP